MLVFKFEPSVTLQRNLSLTQRSCAAGFEQCSNSSMHFSSEAINVHKMQAKSEPEIVTFPPKPNTCALGHSDQLRDYLSDKQHNRNPWYAKYHQLPRSSQLNPHLPHRAWEKCVVKTCPMRHNLVITAPHGIPVGWREEVNLGLTRPWEESQTPL